MAVYQPAETSGYRRNHAVLTWASESEGKGDAVLTYGEKEVETWN